MPSTGTVFPAFLRLEHADDGSAKSSFLRAVDQTLGSAETRFKAFGDEAARQLNAALSAPRTASGSLDLGAAQARAAAEAAQARAIAAREIATATAIAARAEGDYSQSARLSTAAANALALETEEAARAARAHADALAQVQAQLDRTASGTNAVVVGGRALVAANDAGAVSAGQHRAGVQQLGFQLSDLGVQFGMAAQSANPMKMALIGLSQQTPQVIQALAMMRGEAGGLLGFLSGPWGMGLMAAGTVLGSLALAHNKASDASKDHKDAAAELTKALADLRGAAVRESQSTYASIQADIDRANSLRQRAQEARKAAIAELQLAQQKARNSTYDTAGGTAYAGGMGFSKGGAAAEAAKDIAASNAKIAALNADIAAADQTIRLKRGALVRKQVEESLDAGAAANGRYERTLDRLNGALQAGTMSEAEYRSAVTEATKARDAATEAAKRSAGGHRAQAAAMREARRAAVELARDLDRAEAAADAALRAAGVTLGQRRDAATAAGLNLVRDDLARQSADRVAPFIEATRAAANWRAELDLAADRLERIGGLGSDIAKWTKAARGDFSRLPGATGLAIGTILAAPVGRNADGTADRLGDRLEEVFSERGTFGKTLASVMQGAGSGLAVGSIIYGQANGTAQLGGAIGGAIGQSVGEKLGAKVSGALGKALGPLGSIAGGLLGGALGSLFSSKPRGSGTVTESGVTTSANNGAIKASLDSFGLGLQQAVEKIADQLGGRVGSYDVGIGAYRGGYIQVASTGRDPYLGSAQYSAKSGQAIYDGLDATAALRAAISNAIQDGAIEGVRAGTQALLRSGTDIERQLSKAMKFEGVFTSLAEATDPVGAALDRLNRQFSDLKDIFREAGASAAELGDLERLYGIERAKAVKAAMAQVTGDLQGLLDDLGVGNSARSLREREGLARAALDPLAARVAAGDTTAFSDFASASRTLLDISRQLNGSQSGFFADSDRIASLTQSALDKQKAIADAATSKDSPFAKSSAAMSDNASVVSAIQSQTDTLAAGQAAMNANLAAIGALLAARDDAPTYSTATGTW